MSHVCRKINDIVRAIDIILTYVSEFTYKDLMNAYVETKIEKEFKKMTF